MAEEVKIPINADGSITLSCGGGEDAQEAIIGLCGCLCCPTGNECLYPIVDTLAAFVYMDAVVPGLPSDSLQVNGQPEGYQILGTRFDIVVSSSTLIDSYTVSDPSPLRDHRQRRQTTIHERRERYRVAPYGLDEEVFLADYATLPDAPDDSGGGLGWRRTELVIVDHTDDTPVLEVWENPDPLVQTVSLLDIWDGETLTDTTETTSFDSFTRMANLAVQNNALGAVNPTRCDGLFWRRPPPAGLAAMGNDSWFTGAFDGLWAGVPDHPIFAMVVVDGQWRAAPEATLAGWQLLANGGSFDTGVVFYGYDGPGGNPIEPQPFPGARAQLHASVQYGDASSSSVSWDYSGGYYEMFNRGDHGWDQRLERIEGCSAENNLEQFECPDPNTLPRAAIACDRINAPVGIIGYNPDTRPAGMNSIEVTYPLGAQPGDPGSTTWSYLPTNAPTMAPGIGENGRWKEETCPEMFAVYGLCDDPSVTILIDELADPVKPSNAVTALIGGERYTPLGATAPGVPVVVDSWSTAECGAVPDVLWERCHALGSGDQDRPDYVRTGYDLGDAQFMWTVVAVAAPTAGHPDCFVQLITYYRRIEDDGGEYPVRTGWPGHRCSPDFERYVNCGNIDPSGGPGGIDDPAVLSPPLPPGYNPMEAQLRAFGCSGCGDPGV